MRIRQVNVETVGTIPLQEVSGLALARQADRSVVIAVGDRTTTVAWSLADEGVAGLRWTDEALPAGTIAGKGASQLEAVAADGGGAVLLVQEWPNRALLLDIATRRVTGSYDLVVPASAGRLAKSWLDPDCSHTEGVLLLREGHLLVAKEKDPVALLEFGPAGSAPAGFTQDQWLRDGEAWSAPGSTLELLAAWYPDRTLAKACPDFSDLSQAPGGQIAVLSDQGQSVALLAGQPPATDPMAGELVAETGWQLEGASGKPEGLVVLPDGEVLVAVDRKGVKINLYEVPASVWDAPA